MLSIITSYLLQSNKCALPHVGFFTTELKPASIDIVNHEIFPPAEEITFSENAILLSPELVKYIAVKQNISESEANKQLAAFCRTWKQKIESGETLCFDAFGSLQKNSSGSIYFKKEVAPFFFKPVYAEKVLHGDAEHNVLVGDTETTSVAMNEYYSEEPRGNKNKWFVWAIVLTVLALLIIAFSFYDHKFSSGTIGNRSHFFIKTASETHFNLSK